jgi:hypothetical protein
MDTENLKDQLALVSKAETEGMATWSEDKRKDFSALFEQRANVTRYLLLKTAERILETAMNRRFISSKHLQRDFDVSQTNSLFNYRSLADKGCNPYHAFTVGGRSTDELDALATSRAEAVLEELPPLKDAVKIIDPLTAKKIDQRDVLIKKVKLLKEKLEELAGPIVMGEVDQAMTVGAFRQMVKDRTKKRNSLVETMNEVGEEGTSLDQAINKALYEGLPGLSDAVIAVAKQHSERATALSATTRRVTERVIYGDSKTALELLKGFERDEIEVSAEVKAEFAGALEKLKLIGAKKKAKARKTK